MRLIRSGLLGAADHGAKRRTADQMNMKVIDLLAAITVAVDDEAVTAFGDALPFGEIASHREHVADQSLIAIGDVVRGRDGLIRYDQNVNWRSRMDITKRRDSIVLMDDVTWNLSCDDLFEQRGHSVSIYRPRPLNRRADKPTHRVEWSCWSFSCGR